MDRLSGSDHILMSEMQQRVAALTGIPVHADDAGHGVWKAIPFLGRLRRYGFRACWTRKTVLMYIVLYDSI